MGRKPVADYVHPDLRPVAAEDVHVRHAFYSQKPVLDLVFRQKADLGKVAPAVIFRPQGQGQKRAGRGIA